MPRHEEPQPWWKICENPVVRGLSRLFTLFGVPVILVLLNMLAGDFREMRDTILVLNRSTMPQVKKVQDDHEHRIRDLEFASRTYGPMTPGRR